MVSSVCFSWALDPWLSNISFLAALTVFVKHFCYGMESQKTMARWFGSLMMII